MFHKETNSESLEIRIIVKRSNRSFKEYHCVVFILEHVYVFHEACQLENLSVEFIYVGKTNKTTAFGCLPYDTL